MPEMLDWCGKPFRVQHRVVKTCVDGYPMRCFPANDVVILDGPRCDGRAHGECKHGCRIFWKEAWLQPIDTGAARPEVTARRIGELQARLKTKSDEQHYFCQSTELYKATRTFAGSHRLLTIRIALREIRAGDLSIFTLLGLYARWAFYRVLRVTGVDRRIRGTCKRTPNEPLDLNPGDRVRIKSRAGIAETLNPHGRNRGMAICYEMTRCCGRVAEVDRRVDRLIDERTGVMRELSNTVALRNIEDDARLAEECLCAYQLGDCPRGEQMYWREVWLERP